MSRPHVALAGVLAVCVPLQCVRGQDRAPSSSETQKLVREYLGLDGRTADGRERQNAILALLDRLPTLSPREVRDWRKRLDREQRRGPKLETSGRNWLWEDRANDVRRGLYIVGGETRRPRGLLIGMHGGGVGSGDAGGAHAAYSSAAKKLGWVSICPEVLEKTEHGWTDSGSEEFVLELVERALRTWRIDPDRVYFAGHSMGGYGTWTLGAHHADRVAGLAPSAGAPTPIYGPGDVLTGVVEGVIPSLRNVQMVIFQSTDDPRVPPEPNQKAVELLAAAREKWGGYAFEYWEVGDRGHGFPDGGAHALLEKIADSRRDPVPERITWQPEVRWKRQFYWLFWEEPYTRSIVVADLDRENNTIAVQCDEARARPGLYALVDERVVDLDREVTVTLNAERAWRGAALPTLSTMVLTSAHRDPGLRFVARVPVVPSR